uniref:Uncharacterized protein n=1 Tax=Kalanchoe fedtschenkoi TaxID=63787 RepID=A0A7N0T8W1_KALFE
MCTAPLLIYLYRQLRFIHSMSATFSSGHLHFCTIDINENKKTSSILGRSKRIASLCKVMLAVNTRKT